MENLGFGLQMTVLGMGIVFSLLALLWGLLSLLLRFDREPAPSPAVAAPPPEQVAEPLPTVQVLADGLDPDTLAAITIAVLTHWSVRRRQAAPTMRSYWPGSLLYANRWVTAGRTQQNQSWQRRR